MRVGITLPTAVAVALLSTAAPAQMRMPSAPLQQGLITASVPPPANSARPDLFRAGPETYAPRFDRRLVSDPRFVPCCGTVFGPGFVSSKRWRAWHSPIPWVPRALKVGYLRLVVQPGTARVYVDNAYLGSVNKLRRLIPLEPGSHRVLLRATGYQTVTFDVRLMADETTTYQTDFTPTHPGNEAVPIEAGVPRTFYVIPGCYAGDRPPTRRDVPVGCDLEDLRTIPPGAGGLRSVASTR